MKYLENRDLGLGASSGQVKSESLHEQLRRLVREEDASAEASSALSSSESACADPTGLESESEGRVAAFILSSPCSAQELDAKGRLPLHVVVDCEHPSPSLVGLLLRAYPMGARIADNEVRLLPPL